MLTTAQLQALKAAILADPVLAAMPATPDGAFAIADALNLDAVPDYWVWRTVLSEQEITSQVSVDGTTWSWPQFIARTEPERSGWARMFNGTYTINPSLPQVRQGIADIFSGAQAGPTAQRTHLLAMGRRRATRAEQVLASGLGTAASPSTMTFEGRLSFQNVQDARAAV